MKYVMVKLDGGELLPLLVREFMPHSHVTQSVQATAVSAGCVSLEAGRPVACRASSSLNVCSREEDGGITRAYFDGQNVVQQEPKLSAITTFMGSLA
jgi:hypothetical protein